MEAINKATIAIEIKSLSSSWSKWLSESESRPDPIEYIWLILIVAIEYLRKKDNYKVIETIVKHAQGLVYSLLYLMPSTYQKDNFQAIVGLFLEAQGYMLPQHKKLEVVGRTRFDGSYWEPCDTWARSKEV
jgi:hypothetical protein